jgi:hypothetical protein
MVATLPTNPYATTNAAGSFGIQSGGGVQGTAQPDPAVRFALKGGILAQTETIPMWGGVGIAALVPTPSKTTPLGALGPIIGRATNFTAYSNTSLIGFSVFDQNHAMVETPQGPVPLIGSGGLVNFYELGSGARIWVACDPELVSLEGNALYPQVSWDFTNQQLIQYSAGTSGSLTGLSWSANVVTATVASTAALSTGTTTIIAGCTPAGYNGEFDITVTDGTHFTYPLATNPGAESVLGTYATAGSGALACSIESIEIGNSMTVAFNATLGTYVWNRSGNAALIKI